VGAPGGDDWEFERVSLKGKLAKGKGQIVWNRNCPLPACLLLLAS